MTDDGHYLPVARVAHVGSRLLDARVLDDPLALVQVASNGRQLVEVLDGLRGHPLPLDPAGVARFLTSTARTGTATRPAWTSEVLARNVDEESGDEWPAFEDWLQDVIWSWPDPKNWSNFLARVDYRCVIGSLRSWWLAGAFSVRYRIRAAH